ncbi:probable glucosamine 6-phosphate N-acetyltransferase [Harpegnathos saltator]|uniref:Glucosamine 6-phosphate N-acetyltransferase n=1 Tax=Harpegnathos saltator TaxID=610380 RepID=E2BFL9_HARSA|nr:probable glucosamine 6-phosphate N-acetyltransferase [Harpegnathos saltator]EFN85541.1 Probable glucosamine 6-phosphate N-acetyltransferase [Harpegnathos saltator]
MSKAQEKFLKKDEVNLFNPTILERLTLPPTDGLLIRPLNSTDYEKGFLVLLSQLTDVGNVTKEQFLNRFYNMKAAGGYYIVVIEDIYTGKVIACATLVVEQKFIHNCGVRGRLEDVVVNNNYRGKSLGKLVVTIIVQLSRYFHCYKLSLDCTDRLVSFYENIGFKREPNNANHLNMRFPGDNVTEQSHL